MSEWLDPTGRTTFGIGICDRCHEKFSIEDLHPDPNTPGLRVCLADMDLYDPYRLPARQTEDIALAFTRPDSSLDGEGLPTIYGIATEDDVNEIIFTEDGLVIELEGITV